MGSSELALLELPGQLDLRDAACGRYVQFNGFSGFEPEGIWTDGPDARIRFRQSGELKKDLLVRLDLRPLILGEQVRGQEIKVSVNGSLPVIWKLFENFWRWRPLMIDRNIVERDAIIEIGFSIPGCAQPRAHGHGTDSRFLGIMLKGMACSEIDKSDYSNSFVPQLGRAVGTEARRSFDQKILSGFWARFVAGPKVLDIGFKGYQDVDDILPILEGAIGVDMDYPGYDGRKLPFADNSQDAVYSSHCLEHIPDYINAIREWYRVTKLGGHIITVVPSAFLYERRRRPPSRWNEDHRRFYTPSSLLAEFEAALAPNTYRVRHLIDNDEGYEYGIEPERHPGGAYEIELVIQKIKPPAWKVED